MASGDESDGDGEALLPVEETDTALPRELWMLPRYSLSDPPALVARASESSDGLGVFSSSSCSSASSYSSPPPRLNALLPVSLLTSLLPAYSRDSGDAGLCAS